MEKNVNMIEKLGKGSISGSGTLFLLKERNCLFACMKSESQLLNRELSP
jgi:hypothetical protein